MMLPWRWHCRLLNWADRIEHGRPADVVIGGADDPYLSRWHVLPRNPIANIYLHRFTRSDDDRALHDHPWASLSIVLSGRYDEHMIEQGGVHRVVRRRPGDIFGRGPRRAHRIAMVDNRPCLTLFLTGPRLRRWGFHCPHGWRPWQEFTDPTGRTIGRGCD